MDLIGEDFSDLGAHLLGLIQMNLCCARLNIFSASPLIRGERTEVRGVFELGKKSSLRSSALIERRYSSHPKNST